MNRRTMLAALLGAGFALAARAQDQASRHSPQSGHEERYRLYSETDPSSKGGIHGEVVYPAQAIEQILAIPPDEPRLVYRGTVSGAKSTEFSFSGLPMRKYDLFVIYKNDFYEGLNLNREESTLTAEDKKKINATLQKSEPFFKEKIVHRLEGITGLGNDARCICTYVRNEGDKNRRTFKIVMFKDVGPGWQIVRSRDLYPLWTEYGKPVHHHSDRLGNIRVTDHVTELGSINLKL